MAYDSFEGARGATIFWTSSLDDVGMDMDCGEYSHIGRGTSMRIIKAIWQLAQVVVIPSTN